VLGSGWKRPQALRPDVRDTSGTAAPGATHPIRDRLAHQRLDKLDADLLWETSVRETPVLLRIIEQLRDQLAAE
jgi:hypothetical protein